MFHRIAIATQRSTVGTADENQKWANNNNHKKKTGHNEDKNYGIEMLNEKEISSRKINGIKQQQIVAHTCFDRLPAHTLSCGTQMSSYFIFFSSNAYHVHLYIFLLLWLHLLYSYIHIYMMSVWACIRVTVCILGHIVCRHVSAGHQHNLPNFYYIKTTERNIPSSCAHCP